MQFNLDDVPDDIKQNLIRTVERIGKIIQKEMVEDTAFMDRVKEAMELGELKTELKLFTQTNISGLATGKLGFKVIENGEVKEPEATKSIPIQQKDRDWLERQNDEMNQQGYSRL